MQTIDVVKQFQKEGYQRAVVNGLYVDVLLQFKEACTYVVVVFDCNHLNNLTLEKYESIMRAIRSRPRKCLNYISAQDSWNLELQNLS